MSNIWSTKHSRIVCGKEAKKKENYKEKLFPKIGSSQSIISEKIADAFWGRSMDQKVGI
jgi:hypothetical protein